ncbi:hypothetical protein CR492_09540, partial [Methylocella silvestris]
MGIGRTRARSDRSARAEARSGAGEGAGFPGLGDGRVRSPEPNSGKARCFEPAGGRKLAAAAARRAGRCAVARGARAAPADLDHGRRRTAGANQDGSGPTPG